MHSEPLLILHLEPDPGDAARISALLHQSFRNLLVIRVDNEEDYLRELRAPGLRMVLSGFELPDGTGVGALSALRNLRPGLPFLFVSGAMDEDLVLECLKLGATDCVAKGNLNRLPAAIRRVLSEQHARLVLTEAARLGRAVPWRWDGLHELWQFEALVEDVLGYRPDRLRESPGFLNALVHEEDLPRFAAAFAQERDPASFDCRLLHRDGHWVWTRWTLVWNDGRCRGHLQDISDQLRAREALVASQRLEALGLLVGGITHHFGNLFAAIHGAAELLALSPLTAPQKGYVAILARNCARAEAFRNDLARLARSEAPALRQPLDLDSLAQEAATLMSQVLPTAMQVTFQPHEGLPVVYGVPEQILQVLMKLGINARDAQGSQGRISLRTGVVELPESEAEGDLATGGAFAYVEVEEPGPAASESPECALAMVRAIVQDHEGVLQVQSSPGAGTCFRILLPAQG